MRDEVEKQLPPACEDKEKILLAVQEKLLTDLLERESRLEVSSRLIQEADFVEAEEKLFTALLSHRNKHGEFSDLL